MDQDRESRGEDGNLQTPDLATSGSQFSEHPEPRVDYHRVCKEGKRTQGH